MILIWPQQRQQQQQSTATTPSATGVAQMILIWPQQKKQQQRQQRILSLTGRRISDCLLLHLPRLLPTPLPCLPLTQVLCLLSSGC